MNSSIEWIKREEAYKGINCRVSPQFHGKLVKYYKNNEIRLPQLIRFVLAKELNSAT